MDEESFILNESRRQNKLKEAVDMGRNVKKKVQITTRLF